MSAEGRLGRAEVFLQWKGTDACYDFYCTCNPEVPQHVDAMFADVFTCGKGIADDVGGGIHGTYDGTWDEPVAYCGKRWRLPFTLTAAEIDDSGVPYCEP